MRWYGLFQNNGEYNKDGLMSITQKLRSMYIQNQSYKDEIKKNYPSVKSLEKIYIKFKKIKPKKQQEPDD